MKLIKVALATLLLSGCSMFHETMDYSELNTINSTEWVTWEVDEGVLEFSTYNAFTENFGGDVYLKARMSTIGDEPVEYSIHITLEYSSYYMSRAHSASFDIFTYPLPLHDVISYRFPCEGIHDMAPKACHTNEYLRIDLNQEQVNDFLRTEEEYYHFTVETHLGHTYQKVFSRTELEGLVFAVEEINHSKQHWLYTLNTDKE